jgi:hypothetical protein
MVAATGSELSHRPGQTVAGSEDLFRAATEALRSSGYRPLGGLRCQVCDGVVTVSGVVPSFHLKQLAQAAVLKLAAVRGVRNLVEVSAAGQG